MGTLRWGCSKGDVQMGTPRWGHSDGDAQMGPPRWEHSDGDAQMGTPRWGRLSCGPGVGSSAVLSVILYCPQFADWCLAYGTHGCRVPDRPYSLFEGTSDPSNSLCYCLLKTMSNPVPPLRYGRNHSLLVRAGGPSELLLPCL